MKTNLVYLAGIVAILPLLVGCPTGSGLDLQPVVGLVTFDGVPVEEGRIQFRSLEGDQRSYGGAVEDGKYALESGTGPMRVEVRASRLVEGKFDESNPDEKVPIGEMYIPEMYNSRTELTADVHPGGDSIDFNLVTGK